MFGGNLKYRFKGTNLPYTKIRKITRWMPFFVNFVQKNGILLFYVFECFMLKLVETFNVTLSLRFIKRKQNANSLAKMKK